MNLRQLEIFSAVMSRGTTVGAAHALNMTQPAVSNAIMQLEQSLNISLFNRVKGRLVPTEEAHLLFGKSRDVFVAFQATQNLAHRLKENEVGHLRLAATPSIGSSIMPIAVKAFRDRRPDVKVSVILGGLEEVQDRVVREDANLGLFYTTLDHPLLVHEVLASFDLVCALPVDHPKCTNSVIHARDLASENLISYAPNERLAQILDGSFRNSGCEHTPDIDVRFVHTACEFVAQGTGVAVVDAFMALRREFRHRIVFRPFRPKITLPIYVCRHHEPDKSSLARLFLAEFEEIIRENINAGRLEARLASDES